MIKNIVSIATALVGAGALLTSCNFDQPSAGCIVQDASAANWQVKYDLKDENITAECQGFIIKGEALGVYKFTDPDNPGHSILTLRPAGLYSRALLDPDNDNPDETDSSQRTLPQTAVGKLSDETDAQNFCSTSDWKAGTVAPRPAGEPDAAPTTTITYQFDNVKVYSSPEAPGTQLTGDLTYTRDNCTAHYTVSAIWPVIPCDPTSTLSKDLCGEGSGINPDFDVKCDETLNRCVPAKPIPSFK